MHALPSPLHNAPPCPPSVSVLPSSLSMPAALWRAHFSACFTVSAGEVGSGCAGATPVLLLAFAATTAAAAATAASTACLPPAASTPRDPAAAPGPALVLPLGPAAAAAKPLLPLPAGPTPPPAAAAIACPGLGLRERLVGSCGLCLTGGCCCCCCGPAPAPPAAAAAAW
jgi:hypothetical protein